ncbi:MAG: cytochrome b/b6 domain-containing protein, partial [Magnetococcales bacterium]|nr:cytochrome b/b6 domain-containing protein [Magnetococcales bacterium]
QGNIVHYKMRFAGLLPRLIKQAMFYGVGIFKGEHHPFPSTPHCKFNPLQQVTYIFVMFIAMPGLIITGLLFFFPQLAPEQFLEMDGLWVVGVLHYLIGVFLVTFMIGHIYLATAGERVTSEFKKCCLVQI